MTATEFYLTKSLNRHGANLHNATVPSDRNSILTKILQIFAKCSRIVARKHGPNLDDATAANVRT
jgi:molybdopterin-biosynthesis enzyme MoeA-like protein